MKLRASALLLLLPVYFVSCTDTGAPSGALVGLLTGGALGYMGDELRNDDSGNGLFSSGSGTSGTTGGTTSGGTAAGGGGTITTTTGTGDKTDTNGDGVIDQNDASSGTTTTMISGLAGGTTTGNEDDFFDRHGGLITGAIAGAAAGFVTDAVRKGEIQKKYDEGYAKAKSDAIKEFYWLKRDLQKTMKDQEPPVQYRYYEVEVPAHTTSDGVLIDRHRRIIEVVE